MENTSYLSLLSRKRLFDTESEVFNEDTSKRITIEGITGTDLQSVVSTHLLKLLSPSNACGPIVGKGGTTLHELSHSTGANIKVAKCNEVYPGTQDRVICISGTKDCVIKGITAIVNKIFEVSYLHILVYISLFLLT